jgi:ATP-dependent helicase/nuclease subunit A
VLAEENLDAVRIMSIHKAKGLEFPIVVLAGCQAGIEGSRNAEAEAMFDWSTGLTGLRIGSISDLAGLYIAEKSRRRGAEEQKRLLYVAMTRAREQLIVSCATSGRRANGSFLSMLDGTLDGNITNAATSKEVSLASGTVAIEVASESLTAPSRAKAKTTGTRQKPNWSFFVETWANRTAAYQNTQQSAAFLTPTQLKRQEESLTEAGDGPIKHGSAQTPALIVGDLAHRFLQCWDFAAEISGFDRKLHDWLSGRLPEEFAASRRQIEAELREILAGFLRSPAYAELTAGRILGREVPLVMPWDGRVMEGVIDLIYEKNGLLYLADYKTDKIARSELNQSAERYRLQAEIYCRAVKESLRREVAAFKVIFLRTGDSVALELNTRQQLTLF